MKTRFVAAALALLLLPTNVALAQCGGMVNVNGVCIPPDQSSSPLNDTYGRRSGYRAPVLPQAMWADGWGAIASDGQGEMGIVTDMSSKRAARKAAVDECVMRGGAACAVRAEYKNQCAAVVSGKLKSNIVNARTIEEATGIGMKSCHDRGDSECHVYWAGCSLARRIR